VPVKDVEKWGSFAFVLQKGDTFKAVMTGSVEMHQPSSKTAAACVSVQLSGKRFTHISLVTFRQHNVILVVLY
jgi:hypothetical protein